MSRSIFRFLINLLTDKTRPEPPEIADNKSVEFLDILSAQAGH